MVSTNEATSRLCSLYISMGGNFPRVDLKSAPCLKALNVTVNV
jgi:hypothetical protein